MGLVIKESAGYEPIPAGVHRAVCYAVVDLGVQMTKGQYAKETHQVVLGWELPDETDDNGTRRCIYKTYTASLDKRANLRNTLEAWRGKAFTDEERAGFDLSKIIGINCQIQIVHEDRDGKTYSNIKSIMGPGKGAEIFKPTQTIDFVLTAETLPEIEKLPEWLQNRVKEGISYKELTAQEEKPFDGFIDADLPPLPFE